MYINITIGKCIAHNFFSFKDVEFDFNAHNGLNIVRGKNKDIIDTKNGAGKSTLFNMIPWALYGQLPYPVHNDNIMFRYSDERHTYVKLEFSIVDQKYMVETGLRGKNANGYCRLFKFENNDWVDITKSTIDETRKYISEHLLRTNMETFMKSVFLNTDQNHNFFFLKKDARKEFINTLFDIGVYGKMFELAKSELNAENNKKKINTNSMLMVNKNIEDYKIRIDKFDNDKKTRLENIKTKYHNAKTKYEQKKSEDVHIDQNLIDKYNSDISKLDSEIENESKKFYEFSSQKEKEIVKIDNNNTQIKLREKVINDNKEVMNVLCEDCKHKVDGIYGISKYEKDISKLNKSNDKLKNDITDISTKMNEQKKIVQELRSKKNNLVDERNHALISSDNYKMDLHSLEMDMSSLRTKYESIRNEKNPYNDLLKSAMESLENLNNESNDINSRIAHLKYANNILSESGVQQSVIHDMVSIINLDLKNNLSRMGANYGVEFSDDMSYRFTTRAENKNPEFNNFSMGEKMRLTMAIYFTFRNFLATRSNIRFNILILDEFIDSNIDDTAISNVFEILNDMIYKDQQKIYIISHRPEIKQEMFNDVITVVKENDVSKIIVR